VPPESRKRFKAALALLEAGESEALIFPKVDRASRCTEDFAQLIRLSEEQDWRLIVTEIGIDTRTPMGKTMAHMAVVFRGALAARRGHGVAGDDSNTTRGVRPTNATSLDVGHRSIPVQTDGGQPAPPARPRRWSGDSERGGRRGSP
jgi:hypothetical protein